MAKIDPISLIIDCAEQIRNDMNKILDHGFSPEGKPLAQHSAQMLRSVALSKLVEELEYAMFKGDEEYVREQLDSIYELSQFN